MKRLAVGLIVLMAVCGASAGKASAHVLKIDGDISAILHVNPDDNPVNGVPISYLLYFDDTTSRFSLANCDCTVTIQENGHTLATQPVHAASNLEGANVFTFPKPDVYTLQVSGRPKPGYNFQPFTLTYLERVTSRDGAGGTQPFPPLLGVGLGLGVGLILLGAYKQNYDYNKKSNDKRGKRV